MQSRRLFLRLSSAAVAAAALPASLRAQRGTAEDAFSPQALAAALNHELTRARFQSLVGSSFRVFLDDRIIDIRLIEVTSYAERIRQENPKPSAASQAVDPDQSFNLRFTCGRENFSSATYVLDHGTLGRFSLYLIPGGLPGNRTCSSPFSLLSAEQNPILSKPPILRGAPIHAIAAQ